jgi:hypothetical protein
MVREAGELEAQPDPGRFDRTVEDCRRREPVGMVTPQQGGVDGEEDGRGHPPSI